jgi:hypothetical protein
MDICQPSLWIYHPMGPHNRPTHFPGHGYLEDSGGYACSLGAEHDHIPEMEYRGEEAYASTI